MGYTHYWDFNAKTKDVEKIRKRFASASRVTRRFAKFIQMQNLAKICGGFGTGRPIINESELWLNGDSKDGLDHETFSICWSEFLGKPNEGSLGGFCKTSRKPYDLLVCFALLALKESFRDEFHYFSDGNDEDWREANSLYESFTGKKAIKPTE